MDSYARKRTGHKYKINKLIQFSFWQGDNKFQKEPTFKRFKTFIYVLAEGKNSWNSTYVRIYSVQFEDRHYDLEDLLFTCIFTAATLWTRTFSRFSRSRRVFCRKLSFSFSMCPPNMALQRLKDFKKEEGNRERFDLRVLHYNVLEKHVELLVLLSIFTYKN